MRPKLFIGPVSKEIIDIVIDYSNEFDTHLGLIPSRRQVDIHSGYTGYTTHSFRDYVLSRTANTFLIRDHSGPLQGDIPDDGIKSFVIDCQCMDVIHIDPFKAVSSIKEGINKTIDFIKLGLNLNQKIKFEILTEEAIFPMSSRDLEDVLEEIYDRLTETEWRSIKWVVLQSGTQLLEDRNIGEYDEEKLKESIEIIHTFELLSKEHNGDYLSEDLIKRKFELGLDSINIAPEFGMIQSKVYWENMSEIERERFFQLVLQCNRWQKWVEKDFVPEQNKERLIQIAGHYVFTHPDFIKPQGVDAEIRLRIYKKIDSILHV
jgi:hypothetical protein